MYCTKCGVIILNGERQCKQCGADIEGRGPAVLTARPIVPQASRPMSRLAVCFLSLSAGGLACMLGAALLTALLEHSTAGSAAVWNLGLGALALLTVGFILECVALVIGALTALRLRQERRLKGRRLALAGAIAWLCGAALFAILRTNPHFRPPPTPLVPPTAGRAAAK